MNIPGYLGISLLCGRITHYILDYSDNAGFLSHSSTIMALYHFSLEENKKTLNMSLVL